MNAGAAYASSRRGSHQVFLGYAPAVGKTYQMLAEARARVLQGEDVVIGLIDTHARVDTVALARGLDTVPRLRVAYRGAQFDELDVQACIARRPDWVLVDELAHACVPGTGFEARWQAVGALLAAGVNVMSTMNVQHVESLNGLAFQVIGVFIRETVPDDVLDEADEVTLVDLAPDALIARVRSGGVYGTDQLGPALTHFFQPYGLMVLRDEARKLARRHALSQPRV
jgi:two-component system sensor histidine kinase KdpD